jgi:glycosyltransferase involved in cell wall biosynthesis
MAYGSYAVACEKVNVKRKIAVTKPKVLIDARLMDRSGIGLYLSFILPALLRDTRFSFQVLVRDKQAMESFTSESVSFYETEVSPFSARNLCALDWGKFKCDVAWFPHFCVPFGFSKPFVVTIHDLLPLDVPSSIHGWHAQQVTRLLYSSAARRAAKIIVPTRFSEDRLNGVMPKSSGKTVQIYNPFSIAEFVEKSKETTTPLDIPEQYALFVGNLKQHKRFDLAIAYAAQKGLTLIIVGASKVSLRSSVGGISDASNLIYTGEVDDSTLLKLFENATVVLHPSEYEGYGYVPALALSLGVPILCNRIPAIEEVYGNRVSYFDAEDERLPSSAKTEFLHSTPDEYIDRLSALLLAECSAR